MSRDGALGTLKAFHTFECFYNEVKGFKVVHLYRTPILNAAGVNLMLFFLQGNWYTKQMLSIQNC